MLSLVSGAAFVGQESALAQKLYWVLRPDKGDVDVVLEESGPSALTTDPKALRSVLQLAEAQRVKIVCVQD